MKELQTTQKLGTCIILISTFPLLVKANTGKSHQWDVTYIFLVICLFFLLLATIAAYIAKKFGMHITRASNVAPQDNQPISIIAAGGLDIKVVEALPTTRLSEVKLHGCLGKNDQVECTICLSEFEEHDMLRILPVCLHLFHVNCIASWLASHVTCPTCRASLEHEKGPNHDNKSLIVSSDETFGLDHC